eukprot:s495_g1.t1
MAAGGSWPGGVGHWACPQAPQTSHQTFQPALHFQQGQQLNAGLAAAPGCSSGLRGALPEASG